MTRFRVDLTGLAWVHQTHYVEAANEEEAEALAYTLIEDEEWHYGGLSKGDPISTRYIEADPHAREPE